MAYEGKAEIIKDRQFDAPLYVAGEISGEPERYLADKPYELTKLEFSILKKGKFRSNTWVQLAAGATIGLIIAAVGKGMCALVQKQSPTLESWEFWAVGIGVVMAIFLKRLPKTDEEKEFDETKHYIIQHFENSQTRRVYLVSSKENQK